jgi:hypothetical protein
VSALEKAIGDYEALRGLARKELVQQVRTSQHAYDAGIDMYDGMEW